jgi:hypothetical protein
MVVIMYYVGKLLAIQNIQTEFPESALLTHHAQVTSVLEPETKSTLRCDAPNVLDQRHNSTSKREGMVEDSRDSADKK